MEEFTVVQDSGVKTYNRYGVMYDGKFAGFGDLDRAEDACDHLASGELNWYMLISHPVLVVSPDGSSVIIDDFDNFGMGD